MSPLDPVAWVHLGDKRAIKNLAHCNWEITTLPSEVDVNFIAHISLFDRMQGRIGGQKVDRMT